MKTPDRSKPLSDPTFRNAAILISIFSVFLLILAVAHWRELSLSLQLLDFHYEAAGALPKIILLVGFGVWFWMIYLLYSGSRFIAWLFLTLFVLSVFGQSFEWWKTGEVANVNYGFAIICTLMLAIGLKRQKQEKILSEYYAKRAAIKSLPTTPDSSSG